MISLKRSLRRTALGILAVLLALTALAAPAHAQAAPGSAKPTVSFNPLDVVLGDPIWDLPTTSGVVATLAIPTSCSPGCLQITQGSSLTVNSDNGVTQQLVAQSDGNIVLYVSNGKHWAPPNVRPNGYKAIFQSDGNFVMYNSQGAPLWASNTSADHNAILAFQNDGNLVIYPSTTNFTALWASGTES